MFKIKYTQYIMEAFAVRSNAIGTKELKMTNLFCLHRFQLLAYLVLFILVNYKGTHENHL